MEVEVASTVEAGLMVVAGSTAAVFVVVAFVAATDIDVACMAV